MEFGKLEREIHVNASPEVVFDVISRPEHIREWWPDEAVFEPVEGGSGHIVFRNDAPADDKVEPLTVVAVEPPHRFSFRWVYRDGETADPGNSLLVTFELEPAGDGTRVTMVETGFRERGWQAAELEAAYNDHVQGWDYFIPRLGAYVDRLVAA
ncbi:SRPBCC family protein [Herbiconiux daphne]|uniref:SRPBCC family protein n=1 Tax=Herbiconiux daphne TaxID=2970914 RepID=A0ABT2H8A4_9MICO|nr:SRPBCC family protein [Herbiconiux daphne]MCS5736122.1 SRPBCC family protein [Herbiconiux daphne]